MSIGTSLGISLAKKVIEGRAASVFSGESEVGQSGPARETLRTF